MTAHAPQDLTSLDKTLTAFPTPVAGFFRKLVDAVTSTLQSTLIDTLTGEFHEKFNAMWNAPGDRDAARALRQCDRTHRETAVKVTREVLFSQFALIGKAMAGSLQTEVKSNNEIPDSALSMIDSKVSRLEQAISAIEDMVK
jgi:hypothetical protein